HGDRFEARDIICPLGPVDARRVYAGNVPAILIALYFSVAVASVINKQASVGVIPVLSHKIIDPTPQCDRLKVLHHLDSVEMAFEPLLKLGELEGNIVQLRPTGISVMSITDEQGVSVP